MAYRDFQHFLETLESKGELRRIAEPVSPYLEITEIADRVMKAGGPALLFENPKGYSTPVLANLFGTELRVALGMGLLSGGSARTGRFRADRAARGRAAPAALAVPNACIRSADRREPAHQRVLHGRVRGGAVATAVSCDL